MSSNKMPILATLSCAVMLPVLTSFVLLGKQPNKLKATADSPTITFHWSTDGKTPSLSGKDKFKDGSYANYSDAELMPILIQEAMDQWNNVRGSYLRFELKSVTGDVALSKSDGVNNIVVQHTPSASTAAYASPYFEDGSTDISDCDIVMNDISTSTRSFMVTMTHELGHCVGLGHVHTNYGSIMSYSRSGLSYTLSPDDKAGAIYLYPDPNYGNGTSKELIGCGTIHSRDVIPSSGPILYWFLLLPVMASLLLRSRQKSPEQ